MKKTITYPYSFKLTKLTKNKLDKRKRDYEYYHSKKMTYNDYIYILLEETKI